MKTFIAISVALVVSVLFSGCTQVMETVAGKSAVIFARESVDALADGKLDDVRARFDEVADIEKFENDLRKVASTYPKGQTAEVKSRSISNLKDPFRAAGGRYDYVFDSRYGDIHILTNVTVVTAGGVFKLHELTARRQSDTSIADPHWSALHYLFIVLAFTNLGVVGTALVRWYRKRKTIAHPWWWLAAILLGVGSVSLDWSTGQLSSVTPLRLLALSATMGRELDGPWLLEVAIPLGAVAFLLGLATRMPAAQTPPPHPA